MSYLSGPKSLETCISYLTYCKHVNSVKLWSCIRQIYCGTNFLSVEIISRCRSPGYLILNLWFLLTVMYLLRHFKESRYVCPLTSYLITSFFVQCWSLDSINLYTIGGIEKFPTDLMASGPCGLGGSPNIRNTRIYCGFFRTVFCFSDRRQYCERSGSNFSRGTLNYRVEVDLLSILLYALWLK